MAVTELTAVEGHHPEIEAWLAARHVTWLYDPALAVKAVDAIASLANQARLEPLDEEVVDRYSADMARGDVFPPIIANRVRTKRSERLVLIGGNHRLAAATRAKVATLAAYVIEAEPETVARLTIEDNRRHGLPPSEEERLFQAAHLVANGYTLAGAGEVCGVSDGKVQRYVSLRSTDERARRLGIKRWDKVSRSSRWRLGIIRSDPVFAAAAVLVVDGLFAAGIVAELVARINAARSEEEAFAVIASTEEVQRAKLQSTTQRATPRSKLLGGLATVRHLDPADIKASCASPVQRADTLKRIDDTIRHLQAVRKVLG